ncbi:XopAW family type III secretion system calcium-binding effector [Megalodesulfovibrio paquesii]
MISSIGSSYGTSSTSWSSFYEKAKTQPSAAELFSSTDADGDGLITQTELASALESRAKSGETQGTGPSAEELFASLDLNGDGSVTEAEHEEALETLNQKLETKASMTRIAMGGEEALSASDLFASTDADGDGAITLEELQEALASRGDSDDADKLFALLDADGDGVVTEAEHTEALENMSQTMQGAQAMAGGTPPAGGAGGAGSASSSSGEEEEEYEDADLNQDGVVTMEELKEFMGIEDAPTFEELFASQDDSSIFGQSDDSLEDTGALAGSSTAADYLKTLVSQYGRSSSGGMSSVFSQMA